MCEEGYIDRYSGELRGFPKFCAWCGKKFTGQKYEMENFASVEGSIMHKSCCKEVIKNYFE